MDNLNKEQRQRAMKAVKQKDSKPEMIVRRLCHRAGLRFRLHRRDLPGCPDLVFPKHKTCVFVNGCFWHQHEGCRKAKRPSTRGDFWNKKLDRNIERDRLNYETLVSLGWRVLLIWECELKQEDLIAEKIEFIIDPGRGKFSG